MPLWIISLVLFTFVLHVWCVPINQTLGTNGLGFHSEEMAKMVCGSEQLAEFWGDVEKVQTLEDKTTKHVQIQGTHHSAILQFYIFACKEIQLPSILPCNMSGAKLNSTMFFWLRKTQRWPPCLMVMLVSWHTSVCTTKTYKDIVKCIGIEIHWIYTLHFQVSQTSLPMWLGPKRLARGTILGLHMCRDLHPRLRIIEGNANKRWKVQMSTLLIWCRFTWYDWMSLKEGPMKTSEHSFQGQTCFPEHL